MLLGMGRILKQESQRSIKVRTLPLPMGLAEKLHQTIWRRKEVKNEVPPTPNAFSLLVGSAGSGKTNLAKLWINELIEKHQGFLTMDAAGGLRDYTIQRLADVGWPAEKFALIDFFSPHGHPVIDFLQDDPEDDISPYQITEELVSATAQLSTVRSTPGARELDLARMCWLPLILQHKPLSAIGRFIAQEEYRAQVVSATQHPQLAHFWLGKDSYCLQLGGEKPPPLGGSFSRFSLDFGA
jgi:hypothetical protein